MVHLGGVAESLPLLGHWVSPGHSREIPIVPRLPALSRVALWGMLWVMMEAISWQYKGLSRRDPTEMNISSQRCAKRSPACRSSRRSRSTASSGGRPLPARVHRRSCRVSVGLRRANGLLCVHAGRRHGQRPHDRLPPPRAGRETRSRVATRRLRLEQTSFPGFSHARRGVGSRKGTSGCSAKP